jgi:hypothetical protein
VGTLVGTERADGATATTAAGGSGGGSPTTAPPATPRWPSAVAGRPAALGKQGEPPPGTDGGLEDGFYLWQDFNGWHLWVIGGSSSDRVTVTSDDQVTKAAGTTGGVDIAQGSNTFTFSRGSAGAPVAGVDFNPGYYAKTMIVSVEGNLRVHVGARRWVVPNLYGIQYSTGST